MPSRIFAPVTAASASFPAVTAASASFAVVTAPFGRPAEASGRGDPVGAVGPKTRVPEFPWSSLHGPLSVAMSMVAITCTGSPPGEVTMSSPMPTVPFGLITASPRAVASVPAPHWLSHPSNV